MKYFHLKYAGCGSWQQTGPIRVRDLDDAHSSSLMPERKASAKYPLLPLTFLCFSIVLVSKGSQR